MEGILLSQLVKDLAKPKSDCVINSVTWDSRNVKENSVFLAIKGERVNGEDYAKSAVENGAKFVVTENLIKDIPQDIQAVVPNILDASIIMGKNFRDRYNIDIIGVTGSVGKTTTKEFIYAAISPFAPTVKTKGNRNNELGMPNTIYTFTQQDKFAVLEMGMEALGDVHKLSLAARPKAAVITCIGISHLERLKTRENILKAKLEICDGMDDDGILVLNGDDDYLPHVKLDKPKNIYYFGIDNKNSDVIAKNIEQIGRSTKFTISDKEFGEYTTIIPTVGMHNVMDALSAYTVATRMGFDATSVAKNLSGYEVSGQRQKLVENKGVLFIEDCYNAAPDSMKATVDTMKSIAEGRTIAVFGDMLELGDDSESLHNSVGKYAKEKGVDCMWTFGDRARAISEGFGKDAIHFESKDELIKYITDNLKEGDTIVFKASHSLHFEDIINKIYKNREQL